MGWTSLRTGGTLLHIAYDETYTNNLYAYQVRVRTEPSLELALDLNPNLRSRNKSESSYIDARDLADRRLGGLRLVQLSDEHIIGRLRRVLARARPVPRQWTLVIDLEGSHTFLVRPRLDATRSCLFLDVVAVERSNK
jgi:hypothetical protein